MKGEIFDGNLVTGKRSYEGSARKKKVEKTEKEKDKGKKCQKDTKFEKKEKIKKIAKYKKPLRRRGGREVKYGVMNPWGAKGRQGNGGV